MTQLIILFLGAFLTKDAQGVKWVEFEPSFSEGIFVYNEETLVVLHHSVV